MARNSLNFRVTMNIYCHACKTYLRPAETMADAKRILQNHDLRAQANRCMGIASRHIPARDSAHRENAMNLIIEFRCSACFENKDCIRVWDFDRSELVHLCFRCLIANGQKREQVWQVNRLTGEATPVVLTTQPSPDVRCVYCGDVFCSRYNLERHACEASLT